MCSDFAETELRKLFLAPLSGRIYNSFIARDLVVSLGFQTADLVVGVCHATVFCFALMAIF
jgi:hypothetical protein